MFTGGELPALLDRQNVVMTKMALHLLGAVALGLSLAACGLGSQGTTAGDPIAGDLTTSGGTSSAGGAFGGAAEAAPITETTSAPAQAGPVTSATVPRDTRLALSSARCMSVPTTVPGEDPCPDYDSGTAQPDTSRDNARSPSAPAPVADACSPTRPAGGWLGSSRPPGTYRHVTDLQRSATVPEMQALVDRVTSLVPADFILDSTQVLVDATCPSGPKTLRLYLSSPDGARIIIESTQLYSQIILEDQPHNGPLERHQLAGGVELATNDYAGLGTNLRVWAAAPDGAMIQIGAFGPNVADQTTTVVTPLTKPTGPAPLPLEQLKVVAQALLVDT
jgi:hypothetical protein